jgi:hypothetical protein
MANQEFEEFCEELEALKDQSPFYRTREGLTHRIMQAIQKDKKLRLFERFKNHISAAFRFLE